MSFLSNKWAVIFSCLAFFSISGQVVAEERLSSKLQSSVDKIISESPEVPSIFVSVYSGERSKGMQTASVFRKEKGPGHAREGSFRIASVTKVFTSAAVLRLAETGRLKLTDSIDKYLSKKTLSVLSSEGYQPQKILIRHLMEHTAGLYDYAMDPAFADAIFKNPQKKWTRDEQLRFAADKGEPLGEPGYAYNYSDTGYILLGEIIENVSEMPIAQAVRVLNKFKQLGIEHTYFETLESAPDGTPAKAAQFFGSADTSDWDPSFDLYGGGGLVSTTSDLAKYFQRLLTGQIFDKPSTLAAGLARPYVSPDTSQGSHASLLYMTNVGSHLCWAHGGFFGTYVVYCPDIDTAIAVAVNVHTGGRNDALKKVMDTTMALIEATDD